MRNQCGMLCLINREHCALQNAGFRHIHQGQIQLLIHDSQVDILLQRRIFPAAAIVKGDDAAPGLYGSHNILRLASGSAKHTGLIIRDIGAFRTVKLHSFAAQHKAHPGIAGGGIGIKGENLRMSCVRRLSHRTG